MASQPPPLIRLSLASSPAGKKAFAESHTLGSRGGLAAAARISSPSPVKMQQRIACPLPHSRSPMSNAKRSPTTASQAMLGQEHPQHFLLVGYCARR